MFSLFGEMLQTGGEMKILLVTALLAFAALKVGAQEVELPPIVISGTFELRQGPSVVDLFTLHLQKQIETRWAVDEILARSPWYYSRLWNYVPARLGSSSPDPDQFFKPQYLTFENQKAEWELRKSEKQSVFGR
jgi:hypothetical protein